MQLEFTSQRLRFNPVGPGDLDVYTDLLTDPAVMRFVAPTRSPDAVREVLPDIARRGAGGAIGCWAVARRDTGAKIGEGILLPLPIEAGETEWERLGDDDVLSRDIEVGYMLTPTSWGKGYATEICETLIDFGFENTALDQIVAVTDPSNHASNRVLEKCGLTNCGLRRAYATETTDYRITRQQWQARK